MSDASKERPLTYVLYELLKKYGLLSTFKVKITHHQWSDTTRIVSKPDLYFKTLLRITKISTQVVITREHNKLVDYKILFLAPAQNIFDKLLVLIQ